MPLELTYLIIGRDIVVKIDWMSWELARQVVQGSENLFKEAIREYLLEHLATADGILEN